MGEGEKMKMNPEIRDQWADALESGEYQQGVGVLYDPDANAFCCLGVLTQLYCKATDIPFDEVPRRAKKIELLPIPVAQWAGLDTLDPSPRVIYEGNDIPLADLNDGDYDLPDRGDGEYPSSLNFREIAHIIRRQL
jgi:hypothetical protein